MATYGCLLLFFGIKDTVYHYLTSFGIKWKISLVVFLFSFVFPVLNIYILYRMGRIRTIARRTFLIGTGILGISIILGGYLLAKEGGLFLDATPRGSARSIACCGRWRPPGPGR